jgi:hypothetical protein
MIDWLRAISPPLRQAIYFAGAILAFFVAVGVGAATTVVAGSQFGRVGTGSAEISALEGTGPETASTAKALRATGVEPPGGSKDASGTAYEAPFVHRADQENSRGDYAYTSDPSISGDANALVLVSPVSDPESTVAASYGRNVGVRYEPMAGEWAIFNQDRAAVPARAHFKVVVPPASQSFVHRASLLNAVGSYTYLDNRPTNGQPDAVLSVTQNWNPGDGRSVHNNHPIDTLYDATRREWAIYNRDGAPMPEGAAFNVAASARASASAR